jgi:uncharacterized protein (UPF0335 family)
MNHIHINIKNLFSEVNEEMRNALVQYLNNEIAQLDTIENKVNSLSTELNKLEKKDSEIYSEQLQKVSFDMKQIKDLISAQMDVIKTELGDVTKRQKAEESYSKAANDN